MFFRRWVASASGQYSGHFDRSDGTFGSVWVEGVWRTVAAGFPEIGPRIMNALVHHNPERPQKEDQG
jgi:hypothetical protein